MYFVTSCLYEKVAKMLPKSKQHFTDTKFFEKFMLGVVKEVCKEFFFNK